MKWLCADSLYCPEQWFCSHLDSFSHYLREAGEEVGVMERVGDGWTIREPIADGSVDAFLVMDAYGAASKLPQVLPRLARAKMIAMVASVHSVMPWEFVDEDTGRPSYDLVISSIPWMVEMARAKGCRAEYMPLAFDTRARACGMGVKRDLDCIFIGTVGPNHQRRTELLRELSDVVTVLPPVFGREYFKTLARAKSVWHCHAEWSRGAANAMRLFEAAGMGCQVLSDGAGNEEFRGGWWMHNDRASVASSLANYHLGPAPTAFYTVMRDHAYENRIPRLIELARSL